MVCVMLLCLSCSDDLFLFLILSYQSFICRSVPSMRFFVCVSQSKGYSREKTEPKSNEKTMGKRQGREDRQLFSLPFFSHPSPITFSFNFLLYETRTKNTDKTASYEGYINSIPSLSHVIRKQNFEVSVFQFDDIHILNSY